MRFSVKPLTGLTRSALAAVACGVVFFAAHAIDANAYPYLYYQNEATDQCLATVWWIVPTVTPCSLDNDNYPPTNQRWIVSGMGNGGVRLQNVSGYRCLDMSSRGLRMFGCHPAYNKFAKFQSWKEHRDRAGAVRLQAFYGGGCLANYGTRLRLVGCTTRGHAGYDNQLWVTFGW